MSPKMALLLIFLYLVSVPFTLNTSYVCFPYPHAVSRCPLICTALLLSLPDLKDRNFLRNWQNNCVLVNVIPSAVTVQTWVLTEAAVAGNLRVASPATEHWLSISAVTFSFLVTLCWFRQSFCYSLHIKVSVLHTLLCYLLWRCKFQEPSPS